MIDLREKSSLPFRRNLRRSLVLGIVLMLLSIFTLREGFCETGSIDTSTSLTFEISILPILQKNCTACHRDRSREGGLNLESFESLKQGGDSGEVILAGNPDTSLLLDRVRSIGEDVMPPRNNKVGAKPLTESEYQIICSWVEQGAKTESNAMRSQQETSVENSKHRLPKNVVASKSLALSDDGGFLAYSRGGRLLFQNILGSFDSKQKNISAVSTTATVEISDPVADIISSIIAVPGESGFLVSGGRKLSHWTPTANLSINEYFNERSNFTVASISDDQKWIAIYRPDSDHTAEKSSDKHENAFQLLIIRVADRSQTVVEISSQITAIHWSPSNTSFLTIDDKSRVNRWALTDDSNWKLDCAGSIDADFRKVLITDDGVLLTCNDGRQVIAWQSKPAAEASTFVDRDPGVTSHDAILSPSRWTAVDNHPWQQALQRPEVFELLGELAWMKNGTDEKSIVLAGTNGRVAVVNMEAVSNPIELISDPSAQATRKHLQSNFERCAIQLERLTKASSQIDQEKMTAEDRSREKEALRKENGLKIQSSENAVQMCKTRQAAFDSTTVDSDPNSRAVAKKAIDDELQTLQNEFISLQKIAKRLDFEQAKAMQAITSATTRLQIYKAKTADAATLKELANQKLKEDITHNMSCVLQGGEIVDFDIDHSGLFAMVQRGAGRLQIVDLEKRTKLIEIDRADGSNSNDPLDFVDRVQLQWKESRLPEHVVSNIDQRVESICVDSKYEKIVIGSGAATRNGRLSAYDVQSWRSLFDLSDHHSDVIFGMSFSPDDSKIATCGADKLIKIVDSANGNLLKTLEGHTHHVLCVCWWGDGSRLVSGSADETIKIWDVESGEVLRTIPTAGKDLSSIMCLPMTNRIAVASTNKFVRIYDIDDGKLVETMPDISSPQISLASDREGKVIFAGGFDGVIRGWNIQEKSIIFQSRPE